MKQITWEQLMSGDAPGFTVGDRLWSEDGETWFRGPPPKAKPMAGGLRVTYVDRKRGEIAVETIT